MQLDFRKVKSLYNWEAADEYFKKTKRPNSKYWTDENERPLKDTASTHFKITKEGTNSYALRLYDKKIVQYHKPGMRRVVEIFNPTYHRANYAFMDNAGWRYGKRVRTDDDNDLTFVCLPFLPSSEPEGMCAYLEFKDNGRLALNDSWVLRFYRKTADASVKEHNKAEKERVSAQLGTIVTLLMLRLDSYTPQAMGTSNMLKLDRRGQLPSNKLPLWALQAYVNTGIPLEEGDWSQLMEYARRVADLKRTLGKKEPVTEEELMDKLTFAIGNMKSGIGKKAMPMWHAKKLPRCGYFQTRAEADRFA